MNEKREHDERSLFCCMGITVYWMTIFWVFTSSPLMRRRTYTPGAVGVES